YVALIVAVIVVAIIQQAILRYKLRQAAQQLIAIFRERGATSPETAKTAKDLKLLHRSLTDHFLRDYRPRALGMLKRDDVVIELDDGRLYLSEANLRRAQREAEARYSRNA